MYVSFSGYQNVFNSGWLRDDAVQASKIGAMDATQTARGGAGWIDFVADPVRLQILRSLSEVTEATAADLALWGQSSNQTLRRHLEALVTLGVIRERAGESDGQTPGRPAARFSLSADVRESVRAAFGISSVRIPAPRQSR